MSEFLSICLYSTVSFIITYVIGHLLVSFVKIPSDKPFFTEFTKLSVGLVFIITAYSLLQTSGITINIGLILLSVFFIFYLKNNNHLRTLKDTVRQIISPQILPFLFLQLIILFIAAAYLFWRIKEPFNNQSYNTFNDFYFYETVIEYLNKVGVEGNVTDWYSTMPPVRDLYHFGELWYSAFYTLITGQNAFVGFYFIFFSHALVIYFLGACSIIEIYIKPVSKKTYLTAFIIFLTSGISLALPFETVFTKGDWWNAGLLFQPKYFFTALFVFYATILINNKNYLHYIVLIGLATILTCTVSAPAILLAIGCLLLTYTVSKKITITEMFKYSVPVLVILLFIGIYTLWIGHLNEYAHTTTKNPEHSVTIIYYLKTAFNCFAGQLVKTFISFSIFLILIGLIFKFKVKPPQNYKEIVLLYVIINITAILSYAIFFNRVDAVQLWSIVYLPFSAVVGFFIIVYALTSGTRMIQISAIVTLFFCLNQTHPYTRFEIIDESFAAELKKIYKGGSVVYFKSKDDYNGFFSKSVNVAFPYQNLKREYKDYYPICLSVFEIPKSSEPLLLKGENQIIRSSVFYRYVQSEIKNKTFESVEKSQYNFMKAFSVKYAYTFEHTVLPEVLQPYVIQKITDAKRKISFYSFKEIND
ncbi:MAG TPA: hypothetical protein PLS10_13020 [Chitinophagales bacterium]|nr:hypothetical protein [Chitinophagales bacterium]